MTIDEDALTVAHKAVEDVLVEMRDSRIAVIGPHGFIIRETDGTQSTVMRLGTRDGLRIAIAAYLAAANQPVRHDCEVKTVASGESYGSCSCGWGTPTLGTGDLGRRKVEAQIASHIHTSLLGIQTSQPTVVVTTPPTRPIVIVVPDPRRRA